MKVKEKNSKTAKKEVKNLPPIRNSGQSDSTPVVDDNISAALKEKDKVTLQHSTKHLRKSISYFVLLKRHQMAIQECNLTALIGK
jgi:hypothetical protein